MFIRDICLYTLRHSNRLCQKFPKVSRLALIETLQCLTDDIGAPAAAASAAGTDEEYGCVNGGVIPLDDEECPPHDHGHSNMDQQIDEMALSIVLESIDVSPSVTTQDFVEEVQEVLSVVVLRSHDYSLPVERIQAMKEKVARQDWKGWIALALASTSTATDGTRSGPLRGDDEQQPLLTPSQEQEGYASILHSIPQPIQLTKEQRLCSFREMMIGILSSSRTIASTGTTGSTPPQSSVHRRVLSRKLYSASSQKAMTRIVLEFLDSTNGVDDVVRHMKTQDAIARKRYDLLVRSEYMDCDEVPRVSSSKKISIEEGGGANDEAEDIWSSSMEFCAICLDSIIHTGEEEGMTTFLPCNHGFCTKCIQEWAEHSPTCPTCREPIPSLNGVSTSTAVAAPQDQENQHPRGERLRQLRRRQEQRQERGKCVGNAVLFFFFCLYAYSPNAACIAYILFIVLMVCSLACCLTFRQVPELFVPLLNSL